jgi:hypothetical protein
MYHNNGKVKSFGNKSISKFEEFPVDDDEGCVGGLNHTFHLVKPLVIVSLSLEFYVTSMMSTDTLPSHGVKPT